MDREQFKSRILSQLKDRNPPIHALMLDEGVSRRAYWVRKKFWAKEHGLEVIIETIDDDTPIFQVMLKEPKQINMRYDYELGPESFTCETYIQERIFIKDHRIVFELSSFGITQKDYLFSFADHGRTPAIKNIVGWSYDLSSGQFVCAHSGDDQRENIILFAQAINSYRKKEGIRYIEAKINNDFMNELIDAMNTLGLLETRKQSIAYILKNTFPKLDESMFVRIVVALLGVV